MPSPSTLLLDTVAWDLVLDASGNMAVAGPPYAQAQDAASAIKTFSDGGPGGIGECFFDTTLGVPWLTQVFGQPPAIALLKAQLAATAETVPGVASAKVFISSFNPTIREITGQVQTTEQATGQVRAAKFTVLPPTPNVSVGVIDLSTGTAQPMLGGL
jgi:hypothetical protein